jgi:thousand and one amino acid protein kinase
MFVLRSQKDNLKYQEAQEEQRMLRNQKDYLDLEVRKFRRRKLLAYHQLEQDLLREVSYFY